MLPDTCEPSKVWVYGIRVRAVDRAVRPGQQRLARQQCRYKEQCKAVWGDKGTGRCLVGLVGGCRWLCPEAGTTLLPERWVGGWVGAPWVGALAPYPA